MCGIIIYLQHYKGVSSRYECVSKEYILAINWPDKSANYSRQSMYVGVVISSKNNNFPNILDVPAFDNTGNYALFFTHGAQG